MKIKANTQGKPSPNRISKTFEPMALLTAISPRPCFATTIEPIRSGIDVPAASTVSAKKVELIPAVSAIKITCSTSSQLIPAIARIDSIKVVK